VPSYAQKCIDTAEIVRDGRKTGYSESAGLNRHVVGVQVPTGKEVANPS
jgi:hypothetical protein